MATFFNTLVLLGILQGFIVIGLLLFSKTNKLPNRILAALIAVIVLASINLYGSYADWVGSPWLRFMAQLMPLVMPMAIGPLLYFYVQSVLSPEFKIAKKQKRHFYFLLIDFVPSLTAFLYILLLIAKQVKNNPGPWGILLILIMFMQIYPVGCLLAFMFGCHQNTCRLIKQNTMLL